MLILNKDATSVMRPGEMKVLRIDEAAWSAPSEDGIVKGNEDSERKSFVFRSKVRTLSSPIPMQLITDLGPRWLTLSRYWREDWSWA